MPSIPWVMLKSKLASSKKVRSYLRRDTYAEKGRHMQSSCLDHRSKGAKEVNSEVYLDTDQLLELSISYPGHQDGRTKLKRGSITETSI
jgi:hypothetical protein